VISGSVDSELRNQQFENIHWLIETFETNGRPVLSIDTKKKEFLGGLYRGGSLYSPKHGLYDNRNEC